MQLYKGRYIEVCSIQDRNRDYEIVSHPGAVVLLPLLDDGRVVLIHNWRPAVGQRLWELPAGCLEPEETPEATAHRELIEETGYRANKLTPMMSFFSSPGYTNENVHGFQAEQLTYVGQQLEEDEDIEVHLIAPSHLKKMIQSGEIHDMKTVALLLLSGLVK